MSALVNRVLILAAGGGLILQPQGRQKQHVLQIKYSTHEISSLPHFNFSGSLPSAEFYGIVGLLTVPPVSYLIAVLNREQVAQVRGHPIYVVTDVTLIPLSFQSDAGQAIKQAKDSLKRSSRDRAPPPESETSDDDVNRDQAGQIGHDVQASQVGSGPSAVADPFSAQEDVIGKTNSYGQFAERWFSKMGWIKEKKRAQGLSIDRGEGLGIPSGQRTGVNDPHPQPSLATTTLEDTNSSKRTFGLDIPDQAGKNDRSGNQGVDVTNTLLPKLLRTTRVLLGSRSFFYSHELDITRRLGTNDERSFEIPLSRSVDPLFFWNRHLALPFLDGGHDRFVLPLMQGFVGQRAFTVDTHPDKPSDTVTCSENDTSGIIGAKVGSERQYSNFLLTLISRRSIKRPGLRYLRRGVDESGDTANSVETEQILSNASWKPFEKVYSFTQIRGSIPLFFSQSPYSFKPVPVLQHSFEKNHQAFKRHFSGIIDRYGDAQIVLLVDKNGGEAEIGQKYEEHTREFNSEDSMARRKLGFEWFDFHASCRGMKFENVSLLIDSLSERLDAFGETVEIQGNVRTKAQSGVLRTNCMDCLDRTNVVQSACGQRALERHLQEEGVMVDLRTDVTTQWFNVLWADNGDAISRQYSNTAALKGDYTRTRQRNYRGAINDLGLTLSRYFNNVISDYFSQAAIDYLLGNVNARVFEEFETDMMSRDPGLSMQSLRANAIEKSSKIVIDDQREALLGAWTLLSPREQNAVKTFPLVEIVLLVTDLALYRVDFDFNFEKVSSFERIDLRNVTGVLRGTYITSTLTAAQVDESRNVGLVIKYRPGKGNTALVNTRSLSTAVGYENGKDADVERVPHQRSNEEETSSLKVLALKALPARSSLASLEGQENSTMSEKEIIDTVCDVVQRAAHAGDGASSGFVEDKDIVSLQEARKSTGLLEQWGYSLKRMVWA